LRLAGILGCRRVGLRAGSYHYTPLCFSIDVGTEKLHLRIPHFNAFFLEDGPFSLCDDAANAGQFAEVAKKESFESSITLTTSLYIHHLLQARDATGFFVIDASSHSTGCWGMANE